jgi:hypothetical protein
MSETNLAAAAPATADPGRGAIWTGRVLSALPILMMLFSAFLKLSRNSNAAGMFSGKFGYPAETLFPIGIVELLCAVLYAIPQTAMLGAILVTTYLGGAVATHVRVGDVFVAPIVLGVFAWLGLYLRDPRLRALVPLRRPRG